MSSKFIEVVAVIMDGVAQCTDQLGEFEVHCVGTSFEIGSEDACLNISYCEDTASGYEELYIDYHDDICGYTTDEDEGEEVWDLEKIEAVIGGVFSSIKNV